MSEILKVLNRKSVELKSEKVEFTLVSEMENVNNGAEDVNAYSNNLKSRFDKFNKEKTDLSKEVNASIKDANKIFERGGKALSSAQSSGKELGINVNDIKGYSKLEKELNAVARTIDQLLTMNKSL